MGDWALILEYVRVLAWLMVAVVGMILFRVHIAALLQRIKGAEFPGGVSLSFGEEVRRAKVLSQEVTQEPLKGPEEASPCTPAIPLICGYFLALLRIGCLAHETTSSNTIYLMHTRSTLGATITLQVKASLLLFAAAK